jgi:endonuclease VIII
MPEGHTIHRLAHDLTRDLVGQRLNVTSPQGRFDPERITATVLREASAHGKHLFLRFERATVHVHLGLFGKFRRSKNPAPEARGALRMRLEGAAFTWDLRGPTACETLSPKALRALRGRLGADPLATDADPSPAWVKTHATRRSIGAVLLDQSVFAGIGNVYRAELLFLLGIHPDTPSNTLERAAFDRLWELSKTLLARGVKENRIVTRDGPKGVRLGRRDALHVYKRTSCLVCGGRVAKLLVAARTLYACETCQPRPVETATG